MKYMTQAMFIMAIIAAFPAMVHARPVSYPGGWTIMQKNDGDKNRFHLHFSPTAFNSVGYVGEYWRDKGFQLHAVQLNSLLKRWNGPSSQANFYLKTGLGAAYSDDNGFSNEWEPSGYAGIQLDWETRRYFTLYENRALHAGDIDQFFTQTARIGIAPYIGDYGDLHTWLMLQVEHTPEADDPYVFTPMVRFFKGVNLVEIGFSDNKEMMFNWIYRF